MPQFVAQILALDGDVLLSNVDISIDFSQQGMALISFNVEQHVFWI